MALTTQPRDKEAVTRSLQAWIRAAWPGYGNAHVDELSVFGAGGFSSDTYRLNVQREPGDRTESYVARFAPRGEGIFPTYDLRAQAQVMNLLGKSGVPVPAPVRFAESDTGEAVAIMPFVKGRIPESNPPYGVSGWILGLSPAEQRDSVMSFTRAVAKLHRLDPRTCGAAAAIPEEKWSLGAEIDWWSNYLSWASVGVDVELVRPLNEAFEWCAKRAPQYRGPLSVVWGDCRFGNTIFDDKMDIVAFLDWETATVGPAELDLGWHLSHRRQVAELASRGALQDLPGSPPLEEQLELYESLLGRRVENLDWYTLFSAARYGVCMVRALHIQAQTGQSTVRWARPVRDWAIQMMKTYDG